MKKPVSATIEKSLAEWIESELKEKKMYRNKSHIIEVALELLKKESKSKKRSDING